MMKHEAEADRDQVKVTADDHVSNEWSVQPYTRQAVSLPCSYVVSRHMMFSLEQCDSGHMNVNYMRHINFL